MRISVYNLHLGGTGRADPLAEVLLASKPDVVITTEAHDPDVLSRLALRLGMDFVSTPGAESQAVAVLTRGFIEHSVAHPVLDRARPAVLEVLVRLPVHGLIRVFGVQLPDGATQADDTARQDQSQWLVRQSEGLRKSGEPHILAGTFYTLSPQQASAAVRSTAFGPKPDRVYEMIRSAGYTDGYAALASPDDLVGAGTFSTQHPAARVDYVFAFGLTPISAWVETDRLAKYASDHYPTGVEWGRAERGA